MTPERDVGVLGELVEDIDGRDAREPAALVDRLEGAAADHDVHAEGIHGYRRAPCVPSPATTTPQYCRRPWRRSPPPTTATPPATAPTSGPSACASAPPRPSGPAKSFLSSTAPARTSSDCARCCGPGRAWSAPRART